MIMKDDVEFDFYLSFIEIECRGKHEKLIVPSYVRNLR